MHEDYGLAVESRVRHIAGTLGVPEFVYVLPPIAKGASSREVGDGMLVSNGLGAVLQVKARDRPAGLNDTPDRAKRWIIKNYDRAVRQGRGSKRTIEMARVAGHPLTAWPLRSSAPIRTVGNRSLQIEFGSDASGWPVIVVLHHPQNIPITLPWNDDCIAISLSDWLQLNRQIRSIRFLLGYVTHILQLGPGAAVPFGCEYERFCRVAQYDSIDVRTGVLLPEISFTAVDKPAAIARYRELLQSTWGEFQELPLMPVSDYRPVIEFLDNAPASVQAYIGKWLLSQDRKLSIDKHWTSGCTLVIDKPLLYVCDYVSNQESRENWIATLTTLAAVRALEWREQMGNSNPLLAVGVRHNEQDGSREYSYVMACKESDVGRRFKRYIEWHYGVANFRSWHTRRLEIGRNETCPCESGRKFKNCHGAPKFVP